MNAYLLDTHAVYWYEFGDPRLSESALAAFQEAEQGQALLILHPIVLCGFYYLLQKLKFEDRFGAYLTFVTSNPIYRLETITLDDLHRLPQFREIPELHDRLIAIAANRLHATIVTRDSKLQASPNVRSMW